MPKKTQQELLQQKWERLSRTHEKTFAQMRELCGIALEGLLLTAEDALAGQKRGDKIVKTYTDKQGEEREIEIDVSVANAIDMRSIGILSKAFRDAVEGERQAVMMEYHADRVAIAKAQQLGFILQLPQGGITLDPTYVVDTPQPTEENQTSADCETIDAIAQRLSEDLDS